MATTVTFKLNKDATQFQAGESVGFGIRGGVKYYDRQTKQDDWCNYETVIFAKQQKQVEFYQSALVAGSIVEVTGQKQRIKQFQGNNGLSLSIELLDASIGFIGTAGAPQAQGQQMNQIAKEIGYAGISYVGGLLKDSRGQCTHWIEDLNGFIPKEKLAAEIKLAYKNQAAKKVTNGVHKWGGMMPNTTPDNFLIKRGGFNCTHTAIPKRTA